MADVDLCMTMRLFAAVMALDHLHGMRRGLGVCRGMDGSPVPEGGQMQHV